MPIGINQSFDVAIDGQPYALMRQRGVAGYKRESVSDTPKRLTWTRAIEDIRYGELPDELEHTDVWDDWADGFGHAYRHQDVRNTYHWGENIDARWPRQIVHAQQAMYATLYDDIDNANIGGVSWLLDLPLTAPTPQRGFGALFAYGRRQNLIGNRDSWLMSPKASTFPPALDASARTSTTNNGLDGPPALFGSFAYIGGASGGFYRVDFDGRNATRGPLPAHGFVNAGGRLWGAFGAGWRATYLRSVGAEADPLVSANWSATILVGGGQSAIQDMVVLSNQVFVGLPEGLFAGDVTATFVNVTGELSGQGNSDNFRDLCVHQAQVIGQHQSGIYAYDPTTTARGRVRPLGPPWQSNKSPVQGTPLALTSFGGWLYAGVANGSVSYLLAGRENPGQAEYKWHVLNRLPTPGRISRLHVDGISSGSTAAVPVGIPNRMWLAMEGSYGAMVAAAAAPLYFMPLPRQGTNPLLGDPTFSPNYCGSARVDFGAEDSGTPGTPKVYKKVEVWADSLLSGAQYCNIYYTVDSGQRTLLGYCASSPLTELYFPSDPAVSIPSGQTIVLSIESFTASASVTPVYRAVVLRTELLPGEVDVVTLNLRIADDLQDRRGAPLPTGQSMLNTLRAFGKKGHTPVSFVDLSGATSIVKVMGSPDESVVYQEGQQLPEIVATVKMAVLTMTTS